VSLCNSQKQCDKQRSISVILSVACLTIILCGCLGRNADCVVQLHFKAEVRDKQTKAPLDGVRVVLQSDTMTWPRGEPVCAGSSVNGLVDVKHLFTYGRFEKWCYPGHWSHPKDKFTVRLEAPGYEPEIRQFFLIDIPEQGNGSGSEYRLELNRVFLQKVKVN
jgi:hypothetical protein